MALAIGIIILFSVVLTALVFLLITAILAKKYLKGDFTKVKEDVADQPLLEDAELAEETHPTRADIIKKYRPDYQPSSDKENTKGINTLVEASEAFSKDASSKRLEAHGSVSEVASNAKVDLKLHYIESTSCIVGNIRSIQGLDTMVQDCPRDICFHLKLLPKGKYRMKTPWKSISTQQLAITFTIGPVKMSKVLNCLLCIRLYGRMTSTKFARPICYGEFTVKLSHLIGSSDGLEIIKDVSPKSKYLSTEDLRFTTDNESDTQS